MIKRKKLPATVRVKLDAISERTLILPSGLDALWLFGSYARGEETPLSDLDLAYLQASRPGDPLSWDVSLYRALSGFLGTDELTLVDLHETAPALAFQVLHEGKLLFCRDVHRVADLAERVSARYPEVKRLIREQLQGEEGGAMEVDREKVLSQLRLLEADLRRLREKAALTEEAYLADVDAQDVVMRRFQTAIESCVNIGNHLIARLRLQLAEDYATVFSILGEAGILSRELAGRMTELARFRNLLVHLYWRVDHQEILRRMGERIQAVEEFQARVRDFLASR
ncbi:MAG: HepT-like ribonuclease domain-containing protein [Candidatus Methylomirabilia bacterium]